MEILRQLKASPECAGCAAVSLQPNAGSQGEFAGLLAIREYHASRDEPHRNICLIPESDGDASRRCALDVAGAVESIAVASASATLMPSTPRRQDAARVARAFAGRIQAAHVQALEVLAARDAHRRRGARLDAGQHRVVHGEALDLALERRQGFADRLDRVVGQRGAAGRPGARPACTTAARCRTRATRGPRGSRRPAARARRSRRRRARRRATSQWRWNAMPASGSAPSAASCR